MPLIEETLQIIRNGSQPPAKGPAEFFTGAVRGCEASAFSRQHAGVPVAAISGSSRCERPPKVRRCSPIRSRVRLPERRLRSSARVLSSLRTSLPDPPSSKETQCRDPITTRPRSKKS